MAGKVLFAALYQEDGLLSQENESLFFTGHGSVS